MFRHYKIIPTLLLVFLLAFTTLTPSFAQTFSSDQNSQGTATIGELQVIINKLMAILQLLQQQRNISPSQPMEPNPPSLVYKAGDEIITTTAVKVRSHGTLFSVVYDIKSQNTKGIVEEGPVKSQNYDWYYINFDNGADGWVASANFKLVAEPPVKPSVSLFELNDVVRITVKRIDPKPDAVDDEYPLYTITLKAGVLSRGNIVVVHGCSFMCRGEMVNKPFIEAGFRGNVAELLAMVNGGEVPAKPTPRFNGITYPVGTPNVTISAVFSGFIDRPNVIYTAKIMPNDRVLGYVNWGDGSTNTVFTSTGEYNEEILVDLKHTYEKPGTYRIVLTDNANLTAKKIVKVSFETKPVNDTYTLSDVKSITLVKTGKPAIDGGVYTYTIKLNSGKSFTVVTYDMERFNSIESKFRTTGYDGDVHKLIAMATSDDTYSIGDVKSITLTKTVSADGSGIYTYTIKLRSGKKHTVVAQFDTIEREIRATGYTGDIYKLDSITKHIVAEPPVKPSVSPFELSDVKSVTVKVMGGEANDRSYTLYTVTLKNGRQVMVSVCRVMCVNSLLKEQTLSFVKAGYQGDVAKLIALVRTTDPAISPNDGIVKGASTDVYSQMTVVLMNMSKLLSLMEKAR